MTSDALRRARDFLLARQAADGFWRDYALPPGQSSSWVTAVTGFALGSSGAGPVTLGAVSRAADALGAACRPTGWGYNEVVASDADSSAWALRLFRVAGREPPIAAEPCLRAYLGPSGGAQTFVASARYGTWVEEHADVTPVVGLALVESGAEEVTVSRLRSAVLGQRVRGLWSSFWWTVDAYAIARNLEFLQATGGIPHDVRAAARVDLESRSGAESVFEAANLLVAAVLAGASRERFHSWIVERQLPSGGFGPSRALKLPHQRATSSEPPVFEDGAGVLTAAMAVLALAQGAPS